ncbi:hypothetical protein PsYK624_096270 [Phanerochaete sordida]|uniref:Uncharacterized protein n=1 Tax=Phanerochaete sordida TaxID=48140 RepID=A0A9P3GC99_9APHY|nr:hypothetical protein PsYK624_096270 [Phanerochaete sordida]
MRAQDLIPVPFPRTDSSTFTVPHNVADIEDTINRLRELARGLDSSPNTSESSSDIRKPRPLPSPPPYSSAPQSLRANSSAVALCEEPIVTRKSKLYLVHTPSENEDSRQGSRRQGDDGSDVSDRGTDFLSMTVSACCGHEDPWSEPPALPDSPMFSRPGTSLEARHGHAHSDSGTTLESELPLTPTSYTRLPRRISSRPLPRTPSQSTVTEAAAPVIASNLARKALACSLGEQFTVDSVARDLAAGQPVFEEPLVMVGYAI